MEQIELVNPIPNLEKEYKETVETAILLKIITLEEWNQIYKNYRDSKGYSMIHYLDCCIRNKTNQVESVGFLTTNPIFFLNKDQLEKKFGTRIISYKEFWEENCKNE